MPTDSADQGQRQPRTLPAHFQRTAARAPDALALQRLGDTHPMTWREYDARVRGLAAGLAGSGSSRATRWPCC